MVPLFLLTKSTTGVWGLAPSPPLAAGGNA